MKAKLTAAGVLAAGGIVAAVALSHGGSATPKPQPQYVTIEAAGTGGASVSWQVGKKPAMGPTALPFNGATYIVWQGELAAGTVVTAQAKTSPIPPWLGPTEGWATCQIFTGGSLMPTEVSTGTYQIPTATAIYGTPASCQYTVGQ